MGVYGEPEKKATIFFKGYRLERDMIRLGERGYRAYPLSDRNLEEMRKARGAPVDHTNRSRWVRTFTPPREATLWKRKTRPVGDRWRRDETSLHIKGHGKSRYRAVDTAGQTLDCRRTASRDQKAARRFFKKAVRPHRFPAQVTLDPSGAHTAALEALQEATDQAMESRQIQSLNHWVEPDHRAIKRIVRPRLGFTSFGSASTPWCGIELMPMSKIRSKDHG